VPKHHSSNAIGNFASSPKNEPKSAAKKYNTSPVLEEEAEVELDWQMQVQPKQQAKSNFGLDDVLQEKKEKLDKEFKYHEALQANI
jgi:hypothetical protein